MLLDGWKHMGYGPPTWGRSTQVTHKGKTVPAFTAVQLIETFVWSVGIKIDGEWVKVASGSAENLGKACYGADADYLELCRLTNS